MSDVHVGVVDTQNGLRGCLRLIYHIPVTSKKDGVVPTANSSLGDSIASEEAALLASGDIIEVPAEITIERGMSKADIVAAIKRSYAATAAQHNKDYALKYLFYGEAFDV